MSKTPRYASVLMASLLCQSASALAQAPDKSGLQVQEKCAAGDPLCVDRGMTILPAPGTPQPGAQAQSLSPRRVAHSPTPTPVPASASHEVAPIQAPRLEPVAPPSSQVASESHQGGNTTYEFHDGDGIGGNRLSPREFILAAQPRPKLIMPAHLECQLPEEVTSQYGFDRSLCLKPVQNLAERPLPVAPIHDGPSLELRVRTGVTLADMNVSKPDGSKVPSSAGLRGAAFRATVKTGTGYGLTLAGHVNQNWINTPTQSHEDSLPLGHVGLEFYKSGNPKEDPKSGIIYGEYTTAPETGVRRQVNVGVGVQGGWGPGYITPSRSGAMDPGKGASMSTTARVQYSYRERDWILPKGSQNLVDVLNLGTIAQYCVAPFGGNVTYLCPEVSTQLALRVGEAQEVHGKLAAGLRLSVIPKGSKQTDSAYKTYAEIGAGVATEATLREGEGTVGTKSVTVFAGGAF